MFPRKGSALYSLTQEDPEKRRRTLQNWKRINHVVVFLYKTGLLTLVGSGYFLLLITVGRRTGKRRTTPLEYRKKDEVIHLFASRGKKTDWLRNLKANPSEARVRIGFRSFRPEIKVLDADEKEEAIRWYISSFPRAAGFLFGWDPYIDDLERTSLTSLIAQLEVIQVRKKLDDASIDR
ncbi:MAG: nitroreductase family deazaflavin-dependent oxidoreductase [Candidatus Bathyarchaeota archaeon]|nr:nitroreductase family deazaflavin-dependent oxidoreductase [Candidatus Bathyarchaeota archaeon]